MAWNIMIDYWFHHFLFLPNTPVLRVMGREALGFHLYFSKALVLYNKNNIIGVGVGDTQLSKVKLCEGFLNT